MNNAMDKISNALSGTKAKLLDSTVERKLKPWHMNNAK